MLQVIVASLNPAKIAAAQLALAQLLPDSAFVVTGVAVDSGVAEQPVSDTETYQGARQRAFAAKISVPEADLWIGMEGGIEFINPQLNPQHCIAFAWIQVLGSTLDNASRSASLTLPPIVAQALANGEALGPAMDRLYQQSHNRPTGGAIGMLTQQHLTRRTVYRDTLILALAPWLNPQLYN